MTDAPALLVSDVGVWVTDDGGRKPLVADVDWRVERGEHWVLLGPNGAGKTTLLSVAGARRQPSAGSASVLGRRLGGTDVRDLWTLIGAVDNTLGGRFGVRMRVEDVILSGATGTTRLLRGAYGPTERERAAELGALLGCEPLYGRTLETCSSGERQRALIARALMPDPALLLLDEPCTGLDLPSREQLLGALEQLAASHPELATVSVTHHVEEIPRCASHALLLARGRVTAQGAIEEALTGTTLSETFGLEVGLTVDDRRYAARAPRPPAADGILSAARTAL